MKKTIFIMILIIGLSRLAFANISVRDINTNRSRIEYVKGEVIVKFKPTCNQKEIKRSLTRMKTHTISYSNTRRVSIPEGMNETDVIKMFRDNPSVEYAHLNYICKNHYVPNDPFYFYQWNFDLIDMERAWNIQAKGSKNIIVAVLDSGVAYENYNIYSKAPDLRGTVFCHPYDFINNDSHANDDRGHGTHVTGTICQSTSNWYGVAGMAYGTSIMPVKVLGSDGNGCVASLTDGICWAVDHGARIINMSLGFPIGITPEDIPLVTEAIRRAYENNVIIVASSGNSGIEMVSYPAAYPEVISVGAVHSGDRLTSYSQYGINLEIVAPGGDTKDRNEDGYIDGILQQTFDAPNYADFGFWFSTGTSMAVPHVSGLIALLLTQNPERTIDDVRNILHTTSVDLGNDGWDELYGYGRIDAYNALNYDKDGDGFINEDDCDDNNSNINPGVSEICDNNVDDDCDGEVDCPKPKSRNSKGNKYKCFILLNE